MNINTSTCLIKSSVKSNLHPRFFIALFFLSLVFLSGCISKGKIDIVLASSKTQTTAFNVNVANVQIINNQIVLTGTNLNAVTEFKIKNSASVTALEIESKSNTSLVANTLANVNFAVGAIFDFVLSNASAASTFQVNFSLCDSLLGGKGFDCLIVPNDKDVLSFDAATDKWVPRNVNGLTYKGTFDASPGLDPVGSPLSGDYYLINAAGVINTVSYAIGDWIVYNADDLAWQKVSNSKDVLSVFGRTGVISAKEGDYNLTKMSDVDLTTVAPVLNQILKFNGTNWVPGTLVIPAAATGSAGAPSYSFSGNTNTGIFSPGTNQVAITSNGVERLRVNAAGNVGIGTTSPGSALEVNGTVRANGGLWGVTGVSAAYSPNSSEYSEPPGIGVATSNYGGVNGATAGISMETTAAGPIFQRAYIGVTSNATGSTPTIVIGQATGATAYTERMRIDKDGNVGIGVTAPTNKLEVAGSFRSISGSISSAYSSATDLTIDFSQANIITTTASCGAVSLSNMQDGGSYTLIVTGGSSGICTFAHTGVSSFKFSPTNGLTDTSGSGETVYTFLKVGAKVYVSWITGMK